MRLGMKGIDGPKTDEEYMDFQDLYFELKQKISFVDNPGDITNSLSDLCMSIWNFRRQENPEKTFFLTRNVSIMMKAAEIEDTYGVRPVTPTELDALIRFYKKKESEKTQDENTV